MFDKFFAESVELIEEGRKGCFKPLAPITKMLNTTNNTLVFKELKSIDIDGQQDVRYYAYKSGENYKVIDKTLECLKGDDGKVIVLSRSDVLEALTNLYDIDEIEEEQKQVMSNKQNRRRLC
ncbi:hypothetical protein ACRZ5S_06745 [Vibrio scophthalmi]|uniref:hypothetical protein n=1 Tax=Vibrio scophthalmi TaxID=45658 RepID=UPI003EC0967D